MATPFQERSPCQTASYPRVRRAFTGKAPCSTLSSWRLTTSGSVLANQAKRLSSRLLMLLMLKVAILTKSSLSLYVWVRLSKGAPGVRCSGRHYFTGGKKWKTMRGLVPEVAGLQPRRALGSSSALSGRRKRTDHNVIPIRISERELLGLSVRIRRTQTPGLTCSRIEHAWRESCRARVQDYLCFCTLSKPFSNWVTSGVSPYWRPSRPMTRQRKLPIGSWCP